MTVDPPDYPPLDPDTPIPDDAGELLPDTPDVLPPAPTEPEIDIDDPDDPDGPGGVPAVT